MCSLQMSRATEPRSSEVLTPARIHRAAPDRRLQSVVGNALDGSSMAREEWRHCFVRQRHDLCTDECQRLAPASHATLGASISMTDFFINIAAGIALSVTSWLLFRVATPRYFAWRYRAPTLGGQWNFFDSEASDAKPVGIATVLQSGELLNATVTRTTSRSGRPISRSFDYRGRVRDGQVQLNFEERQSNGFTCGSVVLKVSGDAKRLGGYTVYFDRDSGLVVANQISFRRGA